MSDAEIDRMKPEEAHRLLGVQPSPKAGPRPVPLLGRDARDRFDELRDFMLRDLPHLWPAMEACLCACSVLRFKDRPTPLMLVLLGRSGSGKSTILDMLTLGKHWVICVLGSC
jgi:hypothetical protein